MLAFALATVALVPLLLTGALGRALDPRSFSGFALVLGAALAVPLYLLPAKENAAPLWWVGVGLAALAALQVVDVLVVWTLSPGSAGTYAASASLAKAVFLLELPAVARATRPGPSGPGSIRGVLAWSIPAAALTALIEIAPGRLLSLAFGSGYADATGPLRTVALSMLLAGLSLAAVQVLLAAGRISWVSWVAPLAAAGIPLAFAAGTRPELLALWMLLVQAAVFALLAAHAVRVAFPAAPAKRVLFLAWRDTRHPEGGGSEVFVEEMARGLAAAGHDVTIFCAGYEGAPRSEVVEGVRFVRRGGRKSVYLWAAWYHLTGRLHGHDVVVDVQNGVPFFSPLYCSRPVVVLIHHLHQEQWPMVFPERTARVGWWIESRLAPALYARASYVTVSDATRSDLGRLGVEPERVSVVHNGVRLPAASGSLQKTPNPSICFLGRLVPHKRVEVLLESAARLREDHPDLTVTVVGQGWWEPKLFDLRSRLGLEDCVRFTGWVDEETKARILEESWVLAMPSVKEGWGIAVMEAAAAGIPAVGFRVGGLAESIQDGTTGLVADDEEGFQAALRQVLEDGDHRDRLGARARERAATFAWGDSVSAFEKVLDGAVARSAETIPAAVYS
ncbi:MAG: glycosyltransferase [Actinomycetota bacterium]|nr:glycosyltransferase [Actinomycetota bacterium]